MFFLGLQFWIGVCAIQDFSKSQRSSLKESFGIYEIMSMTNKEFFLNIYTLNSLQERQK